MLDVSTAFEAMVDNLPDVVSRVDLEGRYLYINRAVERQPVPRDRSYYIGKTAAEVGLDPATVALINEAHRRAIETKSEQRLEFGGAPVAAGRGFETRFIPEFDSHGEVRSLLRITREITGLGNQQLEERYRLAARASHALVYEWDLVTGEVSRSEAAQMITGYTSDEMGDDGWWRSLIHPDDRSHLERALEKVFTGEHETFEVAYRIRHKDGSWRYLLDRGSVVRADGRSLRIIGSSLDVTDARRAEERVMRLVESNLIAVFTAHASGLISEANDAFLRITGYTRDDLEAGRMRWDEMTPPEWMEQDRKYIEETQARGGGAPFEKEYFRKDGSRVPVLIGPAVVEETAGEYIVFAVDLSEQKAAQERERASRDEAERANQAKDEFLATLSHELRTPMTAILGWTSMFVGGMVDDETRELAFQSLHGSALTQARLIDDLLDISRIATGKLFVDMRPLQLQQVVRRVVESFGVAARNKNVDLTQSVDEEALLVTGDEKRIAQIISNLVSNAIKFTPDGGYVRVAARRDVDRVVVSVSDNGIGIAPEFLPNVFDRFSQQETGHSRSHGGLGLGLAIVKELVEMHGGSVAATSEGSGRGATFTVSLPA